MKLLELLHKHGLTLEVISRGKGYDRRTYVVAFTMDGRSFKMSLREACANRGKLVRELRNWAEKGTTEETTDG